MTDPAALEARKRELLAEVERIDAQLKEGPLLVEADNMASGHTVWDTKEDYEAAKTLALAALRRGMELAPRAAMGEREIEELANQCLADHGFEPHRGAEFSLARLAIRETLARMGAGGEA